MENGDARLQKLKIQLRSMIMAFAEPLSPLKISKEYKSMFDEEINFKQFGYSSLLYLLLDCSDLQQINASGQTLFKAKGTEETQELQKMISSQKKKKKSSRKSVPSFQRTSRAYRSFAASSNIVSHNSTRLSCRAHVGTNPFKSVSKHPIRPISTALKTPCPNAGIERILRIVNYFDGRVTLQKFRDHYKSLYGNEFDRNEMKELFDLKSFFSIHSKYLSEKINVLSIPGGYMLISKDITQKQMQWEKTHVFEVVPKNIKWDKPSLRVLYDNMVHLLVEMYPESILLSATSEVYERYYAVQVDPEQLFSKSWDSLVVGVFKDKLYISDGYIKLRKEVILSKNLMIKTIPNSSKCSTVVSASDIMLGSTSDEDESADVLGDSDVESLASAFSFSTSSALGKESQRPSSVAYLQQETEDDNPAGFGFGRMSSLRKSCNNKKVDKAPPTCDDHAQREITCLKQNKTVIECNKENEKEDVQSSKKGRGFGFRSLTKAIMSLKSDKEKKSKVDVSKTEDSITPLVERENRFITGVATSVKGFEVKLVGSKYNNIVLERAPPHS